MSNHDRKTQVVTGRPGPAANGFTLIELMAVLVILGIAAAIVVPMLGGTGDVDAVAAARRLQSDIRYAQNYAITHQTRVRIVFNSSSRQYVLSEVPPAASPVVLTHPVTKRPYVVGFNAIDGLASVGISKTTFVDETLEFDSLGSPSSAGAIDLVSGRANKTVSVSAVTGKVTIE